jgi:hypothetical protein
MQLAAVVVIVGLAAGYVARATWRTFAGKKAGCGSGCGKCAAPAPKEPDGRFPLPQA